MGPCPAWIALPGPKQFKHCYQMVFARIEELYNHLQNSENHSKMARNKVKLRTGRLVDAFSSIEGRISFLVKS